jgi:hypothetical protein
MDQFQAQATWDEADGNSMVIKFKGNLLSKQEQKELARFRSRACALALLLPGSVARPASIVGYSIPENSFYLAWL